MVHSSGNNSQLNRQQNLDTPLARCKVAASLDMKITPVKLRGERRYKLEARAGGKRTRQIFKSRAETVMAQKVILKPQEETGRWFAVVTTGSLSLPKFARRATPMIKCLRLSRCVEDKLTAIDAQK
jgi:hypothetical protein